MASVVVFIGLLLFMFQAGYQWHKWQSTEHTSATGDKEGTHHPRDSMLTKI